MALFSLRRYAWNFPSNNHGQIFGIADSGVETFNGTPIKSLAREICQNSIDANLKNCCCLQQKKFALYFQSFLH